MDGRARIAYNGGMVVMRLRGAGAGNIQAVGIRQIFMLALFALWLGQAPAALVAQPLRREPNATLRLPQNPGSFGYTFTRVFPNLTFPNGVAITTPPGETNRLFIVERQGRVAVVKDLAAPTREVFMDISARVRLDGFNEMGLLGIAFHPRYAENGRFFLFYTATAANTRQNRLSEFRVRPEDLNRGDPSTERILIQQRDDAVNHNGGDLHFGPDGYLYVSLGDEGGANDTYSNSQKLTNDFFAGILRIDIDQRPGSLPPNPHLGTSTNYAVPPDNPYVGATSFLGRAVDPARVRTEFWSVGLRNPWRISFDDATGELWVGDVGQGRRESIFVTSAGANHGWAFREGTIEGPLRTAPADFLTNPAYRFTPPIWDYPHQQGAAGGFSVTGGLVYRGSRLAQLHGAYVFSDYVSGNVWALVRSSTGGPPSVVRLGSSGNIAAFGADPRNGDLLAINHETGILRRLDYSAVFTGDALPERLSETGAFRDLATLQPEAGLVPYNVNLPFWSDGALKRRWFSIPDTNQVMTYRAEGAWLSPTGTVWVKHFDMELTNGAPQSRRRLETRFLVRNSGGVYGVTYRWNAEQTDALLVPEEGADEALLLADAGGITRTQVWHYPSRAECLVCHNEPAGHSLSFNTAQLNLPWPRAIIQSQVDEFAAAGYFSGSPGDGAARKTIAPPEDESASLTWRARSWLAVNCGYCHHPNGRGGAQFDARIETPLELARIILGPLNDTTDTNRSLITPGSTALSELHARMSRRGSGQMPPLATSVVDPQGLQLLERWINQAAGQDRFETWRAQFFPDGALPDASPDADPDADGRKNRDEFLLRSSPLAADAPWLLRAERTALQRVRLRFARPANRAVVVESAPSLHEPAVWSAAFSQPETLHELDFPSTASEVELEAPITSAAQFFRARLIAP